MKNSLWDMLASFMELIEHWRNEQRNLCSDWVGWGGVSRCSVDGVMGGPRKALSRVQQILKALHKDQNLYPDLRAAVKSSVEGDIWANMVPISRSTHYPWCSHEST